MREFDFCRATLHGTAFVLAALLPVQLIAEERFDLLGVPFQEDSLAPNSKYGLANGQIVAQSLGLTFYDHGDPTIYEQLMLELVNRARSDPGAEAARLGIDLNEDLPPGTIIDSSKQPLAPNTFLTDSSRDHSDWMLLVDTFSHTGENGSTASERMADAGYSLPKKGATWTTGENIATSGSTGPIDLGDLIVQMHDHLFHSSGHRKNICKGDFEEVGIGIREGLFYRNGTNWNSGMTTQNFARSSATPGPFITGVIYEDLNDNEFYDLGEGIAGVEVTVSGSAYYGQSSSSGGYAVPLTSYSASVEVTFSGEGWEESRTVSLEPDTNLKVDLLVGGAPAPWYSGAADLGDNWFWLAWLGYFNVANDPWIFHAEHGWLYPFADDQDSVYFWDAAMGSIIWTSDTVYPSVYRFSDGKWLFYEVGSSNPRWFVDLVSAVWEQW